MMSIRLYMECGDKQVIPKNMNPGENEYGLILETHNPGDIAFIKSILLAENIVHFIQGESVAPYLFNALPMRVLVRKDHIKKATEILKDVKLSFSYNLDK